MNRFDGRQFIKDFEVAWNKKDASSVITKYYEPNVEYSDPSTGKLQRGTDALRKTTDAWFNAFSEMRLEVTQLIQSGNDIAILQHCKGRNTGELEMSPGERLPATNKTVEIDVAEFVKINEQGKVVRDVVIMDSALLMMQLGHMPAPGQAQVTGRAAQR